MDAYSDFVSRNSGYISGRTQKKIQDCKLLIAGCGVGSQIAVAAARLGFCNFILIDGDQVSLSNLNRQAFHHDQIGKGKSSSLAELILKINPQAQVKAIDQHFDETQTPLLEEVDFVIDTIDFLSLKAVVTLHETAEALQIPLISGMTVGWGACCMYFPNQSGERGQFRQLFGLANETSGSDPSYVLKFAQLFEKLRGQIDPNVVEVMQVTFQKMADNEPCAAPQVSGGTFCIASMMMATLKKILDGQSVPVAPELIIVDINNLIHHSHFRVG